MTITVRNTKTSMTYPIWKAKSFIPNSYMNNYTRDKFKMLPLLHKAITATSKFNYLRISILFSVMPVMLTTVISKCHEQWLPASVSLVPAPTLHSPQAALEN